MTDEQATDSRWDPAGDEAENLRRRAASMWNRDHLERVILPLLAVPDGGEALDVGTGFGALALLLADLRPDLRIVGVDPEPGLVAGATGAATALGLDRVTFVVGSGEALPFEDARFVLVACQTVLTHVTDAAAVVAEMARVAKPGGGLLFAEWTDRAGMASYGSTPLPEPAAAGDMFRLTRSYSLGRARLGRGDDLAGIRAPILAQAAGLEIVDVRLNDRVRWAVPPYRDADQLQAIEEATEWARSPAADGDYRTWVAENLAAAGEGADATDRYLRAEDDPGAKQHWLASLDAGDAWLVAVTPMILTIARRPSPDDDDAARRPPR